jgi:hypothetical protein
LKVPLQIKGFPGALMIAQYNAGAMWNIFCALHLNGNIAGDPQPQHCQVIAKGSDALPGTEG